MHHGIEHPFGIQATATLGVFPLAAARPSITPHGVTALSAGWAWVPPSDGNAANVPPAFVTELIAPILVRMFPALSLVDAVPAMMPPSVIAFPEIPV